MQQRLKVCLRCAILYVRQPSRCSCVCTLAQLPALPGGAAAPRAAAPCVRSRSAPPPILPSPRTPSPPPTPLPTHPPRHRSVDPDLPPPPPPHTLAALRRWAWTLSRTLARAWCSCALWGSPRAQSCRAGGGRWTLQPRCESLKRHALPSSEWRWGGVAAQSCGGNPAPWGSRCSPPPFDLARAGALLCGWRTRCTLSPRRGCATPRV